MDPFDFSSRYVVRSLTRSKGLLLAVTIIMALTIGSSTAIFTVVKAVLLTELPYRDVGRLAIIWATGANSPETIAWWARDYQTIRDTTRSFESVGAFTTRGY